MSYENQYSGRLFQNGGPPFGLGDYYPYYSGYSDQYGASHRMMNGGYHRNKGGYGGGRGGDMYDGIGMYQMRSVNYGGPSSSRHYMNDRVSGRSMGRGQMKRKRLPQRSPGSGPLSKRPNIKGNRSMPKSRGRKESRGRSKIRHDRNDAKEPTIDMSDGDYDLFENWKSSDEDDKGKEEKDAKENEKPESDDTPKTAESKADDVKPKKRHICYVCKVFCSTEERMTKHQNSKSHTTKIEELLAIRREKKKGTDGEKKDTGLSEQDKKKSYRKPSNWCGVCSCSFTISFFAHRRTKKHMEMRDKRYPKCRPCRLGFKGSDEYRNHCKSNEHKQKSAEFHYLNDLASGSDEDEAAIEPAKVEEDKIEEVKIEEVKIEETCEEKTETKAEEENAAESEVKEKNAEAKEKNEKKDEKENKEVKKPKPKGPKYVGQSFVVPVKGYYCKLCHKFFKDVTVAKSKHCRSIMHTEAFKKAMKVAVEKEEERQRLAEEQDKQSKEAAEAEELAAEIAAIVRDAKEAARKEIVAKKAGNPKVGKSEVKDISEDASKDDNAWMEVTEESQNEEGMENKEEMKDDVDASKEVKDSAADVEKDSNAASEKPVDKEPEKSKEIAQQQEVVVSEKEGAESVKE